MALWGRSAAVWGVEKFGGKAWEMGEKQGYLLFPDLFPGLFPRL